MDIGTELDIQRNRLRARGCPESILEMMSEQRSRVVEATRVADEDLSLRHPLSILTVIPPSLLSLGEQMRMVEWEDDLGKERGKGGTGGDEKLKEAPGLPSSRAPYYVLNPGALREGWSPKIGAFKLLDSGHSAMYIAELVSGAIHHPRRFMYVNDHDGGMVAAYSTEQLGSGLEVQTLGIGLDDGQFPTMMCVPHERYFVGWCVGSVQRRIFP